MSSINSRSITSASLAATTTRVTVKQDAAQAQIVAAGNKVKAASDRESNAGRAVSEAQDRLDALASKPKGKNYQKELDAAIADVNTAKVNLKAAQDALKAAKQELLAAKDALPAAIAADQEATDRNKAADKERSDTAERQETNAQEAKKSSDSSKTDESAKPQEQAQPKGKATSEAAVIGAAAGGGTDETAPVAQSPEGAPAPQAEQDGYSAAAPKSNPGRSTGGSNGVLTDEETQGSSRAPAHAFVATNKSAAGDKSAAATAPAPQGTAAPTVGNAVQLAESGATDGDVVTDSGKHFKNLTEAEQGLVRDLVKTTKELASKGNVKAIQDGFLAGFDKLGRMSGGADADDAEGTSSGKGEKKGGKNAGLGAAGKGKSFAKGATVGSSANNMTPAGNAGASTETGATGATVGATDRPATAELAATKSGKPMVGASLPSSGKSAAGKPTIGAAPTVGATSADGLYDPIQFSGNSEIGKAYTGGMSPMELVQMVMLKAFQEAGEDVRNAAEMMQKQTNAKQTARQGQNALRDLVSYDSNGTLSSVVSGSNSISAKEASNQLSSIDGNIDAIGDDNQVLMIRLQNLTQLMTTMSQAASNMSKSAYDTTKSVIGQIGH